MGQFRAGDEARSCHRGARMLSMNAATPSISRRTASSASSAAASAASAERRLRRLALSRNGAAYRFRPADAELPMPGKLHRSGWPRRLQCCAHLPRGRRVCRAARLRGLADPDFQIGPQQS